MPYVWLCLVLIGSQVYEDMFYRASELNPLNKVTVDPYPDSPVLFKENKAGELKAKSKL